MEATLTIAPPSRSRGAMASDSARRPRKLIPMVFAAPSAPETPATVAEGVDAQPASRRDEVASMVSADERGRPRRKEASGARSARADVEADHVGAELSRRAAAVRAPMPDDTPVTTIVFPNSMARPGSFRWLSPLGDGCLRSDRRPPRRAGSSRRYPTGRKLTPPRLSTSPQRPRGRKRANDERRGAEADEVPDACRAEPSLNGEENDGAQDGAFERPEASHENHENHVGCPLNAEVRLRLERDRGCDPERAGQTGTGGSQHEDCSLDLRDLHADRSRSLLVVADRLDRRASATAEQGEEDREHRRHPAEGSPVGQRVPQFRRIGVERHQ